MVDDWVVGLEIRYIFYSWICITHPEVNTSVHSVKLCREPHYPFLSTDADRHIQSFQSVQYCSVLSNFSSV